jgi:hypothetical protein
VGAGRDCRYGNAPGGSRLDSPRPNWVVSQFETETLPRIAIYPAMLRVRPRPPADFIRPCQPSDAARPPAGPGWLHEIKHDGYRLLARLVRKPRPGLALNEHFSIEGAEVFKHACALGCEGIVSKRLSSRYVSGRSLTWRKTKNPAAPAVRREAEEDWNGRRK